MDSALPLRLRSRDRLRLSEVTVSREDPQGTAPSPPLWAEKQGRREAENWLGGSEPGLGTHQLLCLEKRRLQNAP